VRDVSRIRRFFVRHPTPSLACGLLTAFLLAGVVPSVPAQGQDLQATFQGAQAAMAAGRFEDAARGFGEHVRAVPGEPGLRLNLGMALAMAGRPREAVPHLQIAADTGRPELLPATLFLGRAQMELGQPAKAVKPLETFLAAQPEHQPARQMLAEGLLALERFESAVGQYAVLAKQAPRPPGGGTGWGAATKVSPRRLSKISRPGRPTRPGSC